MAGTEATTTPTKTSDAITAKTPGAEKVIKISVDGLGWNLMKLIEFEIEFFTKSNTGKGRFVVNEYSCQPFGVLHGGTTAYVAESVASMLTAYIVKFQRVAGVELNCNHLRPAKIGSEILLTATPFLLGKRLQVWEVKFETERPKPPGSESMDTPPQLVLVAVARVSVMVIPSEDEGPKDTPMVKQFAGMTFEEK